MVDRTRNDDVRTEELATTARYYKTYWTERVVRLSSDRVQKNNGITPHGKRNMGKPTLRCEDLDRQQRINHERETSMKTTSSTSAYNLQLAKISINDKFNNLYLMQYVY